MRTQNSYDAYVFSSLICRTKESGKKYVKYEVIGHNLVSVPTHFFKIVAYYEGWHVTVEVCNLFTIYFMYV